MFFSSQDLILYSISISTLKPWSVRKCQTLLSTNALTVLKGWKQNRDIKSCVKTLWRCSQLQFSENPLTTLPKLDSAILKKKCCGNTCLKEFISYLLNSALYLPSTLLYHSVWWYSVQYMPVVKVYKPIHAVKATVYWTDEVDFGQYAFVTQTPISVIIAPTLAACTGEWEPAGILIKNTKVFV